VRLQSMSGSLARDISELGDMLFPHNEVVGRRVVEGSGCRQDPSAYAISVQAEEIHNTQHSLAPLLCFKEV